MLQPVGTPVLPPCTVSTPMQRPGGSLAARPAPADGIHSARSAETGGAVGGSGGCPSVGRPMSSEGCTAWLR